MADTTNDNTNSTSDKKMAVYTPGHIDHYKIYESIWRNIDREGSLINQRISWAIILSGGLFAASALLANAATDSTIGCLTIARVVLLVIMLILSLVGIFFSFTTKKGVDAATRQIEYLKRKYFEHKSENGKSLFQDYYKWPRPFGNIDDFADGKNTAQLFPVVISAVWIIVFITEFSFLVALTTNPPSEASTCKMLPKSNIQMQTPSRIGPISEPARWRA